MINFTQAFDSAWERTFVILFRPWDPAKWFVIGFNAFLAFLSEGGVTYNRPVSFHRQPTPTYYQSLPDFLHAAKAWVASIGALISDPWLMLYVGFGIIYLVAWLAGNWIGSRGAFMILDNIVRNRAAISAPWSKYARQGNIWFLVQVGLTLFSCLCGGVSLGGVLAVNWSWIIGERDPTSAEMPLLAVSLLALFSFWVVYAIVLFLIRSFALPLYFKQTMSFGAALAAVARLTVTHPLSILCYLLINLGLALATGFMAVVIFCVICCCILWLAFVPFIGSMGMSFILCQLILPLVIFLRCFQLDCLAQFGPQYNVWTVDVPTGPVGGPPFSLPPPRG